MPFIEYGSRSGGIYGGVVQLHDLWSNEKQAKQKAVLTHYFFLMKVST